MYIMCFTEWSDPPLTISSPVRGKNVRTDLGNITASENRTYCSQRTRADSPMSEPASTFALQYRCAVDILNDEVAVFVGFSKECVCHDIPPLTQIV